MTLALETSTVKRSLSAHAAIGLLAGALLYIVCLSGSLLVFYEEWQRLETPAAPRMTAIDPDAVQRLEAVSDWLLAQAGQDPHAVGAAAVEYLHLLGYTAYAWLWARMAQLAAERRASDEAFYSGKLATAAFFFRHLLPRTLGLEASIRAGSAALFGEGFATKG